MKLLWKYEDNYSLQKIMLYIGTDGNYYVGTVEEHSMHLIQLPPAKGDELRIALIPGFDPARVDIEATIAGEAVPHPDD